MDARLLRCFCAVFSHQFFKGQGAWHAPCYFCEEAPCLLHNSRLLFSVIILCNHPSWMDLYPLGTG